MKKKDLIDRIVEDTKTARAARCPRTEAAGGSGAPYVRAHCH